MPLKIISILVSRYLIDALVHSMNREVSKYTP